MELAILSPDNFPLLDKMRKDLIEVGYKDDKKWNRGRIAENDSIALRVYGSKYILFHNHECYPAEKVTLTASNYNEILTRCIAAINK